MKRLILSFILIFSVTVPVFAEYSYKGKVVSLYDADTFTVEYDIWLNTTVTESSRLMGLDTPELRTKNLCEKEHGYKAKVFTESLILGKTFNMIVYKRDKYGRPLVEVFIDGKTLTDILIEEGYAKKYDGGKKDIWFPDCVGN